MSYEVLVTREGFSILHITTVNVNAVKGWRIQFHDGKEAMLCNYGDDWFQYDEPWLDRPTIMAIGVCIDCSLEKRKSGLEDSYFYDMLIN